MSQQKTPEKKGLKQFSHSIQVLFQKKEFKYFSYTLAAFIILSSAALYYIETQGIFKYPQLKRLSSVQSKLLNKIQMKR